MTKKTFIYIVAAVVLILIVFIVSRQSQFLGGAGEIGGINTSDNSNMIVVGTQDPLKLGARFGQIKLKERGFVVVRGVVNGDGGIIFGVSHILNAGEHNNVQILMDLIPGQEYAVFLYADDGNGIFNEENDTLLRNRDGTAIEARFMVADDRDVAGKG